MERRAQLLAIALKLLSDALILMERCRLGTEKKRVFQVIGAKAKEPVFFNFHDLYPLWLVALGLLPQ
jgi:hypothetical protein